MEGENNDKEMINEVSVDGIVPCLMVGFHCGGNLETSAFFLSVRLQISGTTQEVTLHSGEVLEKAQLLLCASINDENALFLCTARIYETPETISDYETIAMTEITKNVEDFPTINTTYGHSKCR